MVLHHVAVICSDYETSKKFYTEILGLTILREEFRSARQSYKLDLGLGEQYVIELFSFPETPPRPSRPESCGLRHLAFGVQDIEATRSELKAKELFCEEIRTDAATNKKFFFTADPDGLPLEFYEL